MSLRTRTSLAFFALTTLTGVAAAGLHQGAEARSKITPKKNVVHEQVTHFDMIEEPHFQQGLSGRGGSAGPFAMQQAPVGESTPPATTARPVSLQGSALATFAGDVLVLDEDSGELIRTDREGQVLASVEIGPGAAQLVLDSVRKRAYVSDRRGDRVVVLDVSKGLRQIDAFKTPTEPYGLALTPDGKTLLVTTVADRTLVAYSTESGMRRFEKTIGPEPRGVAVSPDGKQALLTFLTSGVLGRVQLSDDDPTISYSSLDPARPQPGLDQFGRAFAPGVNRDEDEGRAFVRNAFAAAFVGHGIAVVPHQLSTPHLPDDGVPSSGGYGGGDGFTAPIQHRLAFMAMPEPGTRGSVRTAFALTNQHQPRAVAYDVGSDTLIMTGYGSDTVMAVGDVSQATVHMAWSHHLGAGCGPTGVAVDGDDGQVVVYCSLDRTTVRLDPASKAGNVSQVARSGELAHSHLSASAQRGREVFRRGNSFQISKGGAMACSNCHAEARSDGLTWFLQGNVLQTPLLAGRVMGTHPFKWDGKDHDLNASLTNTVTRLGGSGLSQQEVRDLAAFLAATEPPRTPRPEDVQAVARGKELFESEMTGCADCHYGPLLTDQTRHEMAPDLDAVDTPSLVGLAQSAPYYHDGSAETLEALLRGKGNIHGMGRTSKLDPTQVSDLVAYLETL